MSNNKNQSCEILLQHILVVGISQFDSFTFYKREVRKILRFGFGLRTVEVWGEDYLYKELCGHTLKPKVFSSCLWVVLPFNTIFSLFKFHHLHHLNVTCSYLFLTGFGYPASPAVSIFPVWRCCSFPVSLYCRVLFIFLIIYFILSFLFV